MAQVEEADRWLRLTAKQRACLDLLLERKTSKEIARILGISKPTVDQRLALAKITLDAPTRAQAALTYDRLKQTYDRVTYDSAQLHDERDPMPPIVSNENTSDPGSASQLSWPAPIPGSLVDLFRDFRRRDHSILNRTMIMAGLLVVLVIVLLAGLGIAQSLTTLIS